MKKYITSIVFLFTLVKGFAQVNDNCINAIPLCSNPSFTFYANSGPGSIVDFSTTSTISDPINNPFPPNAGCLKSGELNPQWLLITIGNAGLLEFVFGAGNSSNPQAGYYDWAMWPYNSSSCNGIFNNTLAPVRCNWNGSSAGGTGLASSAHYNSFGGNSANFGDPLTVNACDRFVICISNYSGVNTLVSFLNLGTASLSCSPNCNPNYSMCLGGSATLTPLNYIGLTSTTITMQPGNIVSSTGSFVVSPTVTTTYTTYISGLDSQNAVQTVTSTSTVSIFPVPVVTPSVINATCSNPSNTVNLNLSFQPPGSTPAYTITWATIPNGVITNTQTVFSGGIASGPYSATVTTAAGCTTTANFSVNATPPPVNIVVNPLGTSHTITCSADVTLTAVNPAYNYTWSSANAVFTSSTVVFTSTLAGTWSLIAVDPLTGCIATQTFAIYHNTVIPVATLSPTFQNITCSLSSITTITATANPSVNVTHQIVSPQGGTFTAQSYTTIYMPGGVGVYTHCIINNANGCSSCTNFTVASSLGFPTYNVTSPDNFTLGCGTKSVATINIVNGNTTPPGGPVSYTLIGPPTSTITPSGPLSGNSTYTVNAAGTWTVITKDNTSSCETRALISILNNTFTPDLSVVIPQQILDCNTRKVTLKGQSITSNVGYLWSFPTTPGNLQSDTISVISNPLASTSSLVANYTLTITDNSSTCKSSTVVPIYQNLYPPHAVISSGVPALTCNTATIVLTNQSSTGIPPSTGFPYQQHVIGFIWEGPTPQEPGQVQTTYIAATTGVYTLTAKDLNNGCTSTGTINIGDNRNYPAVDKTTPNVVTLDCGAKSVSVNVNVTGTTTGLSYSWTAPPNASISSASAPSPSVNSIGNYRVLITNTLNGCASLGEVSVVNGSLTAEFEIQPATGFAPLNVTVFNNSYSSLGPNNITSYWNFANGTNAVSTPSNLSLSSLYTVPGTYTITMYAVKGTCIDTASKVINVELPSSLEIPNVFTPNGDGVNDLFFLKATNLEEINIIIVDRWGHKVYELTSKTGNIAWDGKNLAGKDAAEGTYLYILKATGKDGQNIEKKGVISLFR